MDLIGTLDVEEKARAKDTRARGIEGGSSANLVQKKNFQPHKFKNKGKFDGKAKFDGKNKDVQHKNFKKKNDKKKGVCHVCGDPDHWAPSCPNRYDKRHPGKGGKTANVVIGDTDMKDAGYGIFPTILSVCHSPDWLIDTGANVHVCGDISMFSSYQTAGTSTVLMGNGSSASVRGVGTVNLKFTSGKIVRLKNMHYVPSVNKNLVSRSLLCRDGYKLVFDSNKFVISKYGTFVGKGYALGGLFRLSLSDICNKVVNHICNNSESNVWHSRLCHVNFGCMSRLAKLNLIPSFTTVKGSKCQVCVQAKQPRKSHTTAETRNLAPLELIHSDLCEMNGVLTKGGKKYFMTLIDDSTRYCRVYLLKSKDEALNFFNIYKAEVENQLDRKNHEA